MSDVAPITCDASHRCDYRDKGYTIVAQVFDSEEVEAIRDECARLARHPGLYTTTDPLVRVREDANGAPNPDRIDFPCRSSKELRALSRDPRLTTIVADLLGEPGQLFKDKLIFKPPGTAGYDPHQDHPYWEFSRAPADAIVTLVLALDAMTPDNGAMRFHPGFHRARLPGPPESPLDVAPEALAGSAGERITLEAGDVIAFHSLAPHESARNASSHSRRTLFLTYCWSRLGDFYEDSYADRLG